MNRLTTYNPTRTKVLQGLTGLSIVLFCIAMYLNFAYAGTDTAQGEVQRIFYIHLGSFFGAFVLFFGALIAGVTYLVNRDDKWDTLGLATVEIALAFSLVNIVTGSIWARPIWNTWWTWDPRLTSVTIMWLAYAAYMMLRNGMDDPDRRKRFAAVYGILAFASVVLTVVIIRLKPDTIHPVNIGPDPSNPTAEGSFNLSDSIRDTLLFNVMTFVIIAITVTWYRVRLENRVQHIEARKMQLLLES